MLSLYVAPQKSKPEDVLATYARKKACSASASIMENSRALGDGVV